MATKFPLAQDDSSTLPNPTGAQALNATPVTHSAQHDNANDSIKAIEAKLGYGASVPSASGLLIAQGNGNTLWGNLSGDATTVGNSITLSNTGVVAGTYTNANITVDSKGRITVAANGVSGGGGGTASPLTTKGDLYTYSTLNDRLPVGTDGQILMADSTKLTGLKWTAAPATGVSTVSVTSANGFAGTVANPTTTPAITISTTVTGLLKGNATAISAATAGTDYSAGTSALATGIIKSTTATGALSIAVAGDFPTLNQNTTGSAAKLTTARTVQTNLASTASASFDGSANITPGVTGTLPVTSGGTGVTTSTGTGNTVLSASPTFTGTPVAPTPATTDNSTTLATTAFVKTAAGTQSIVDNEVPAGTVDGANVTFTLASTPATNSLMLYKNGIRMKPGGADYTIVGSTITFVTAPPAGAVLLADYNVSNTAYSVGTNSYVSDETPTGLVNGSNTTFTASRAYISTALEVYINGVKQVRGTHFTETTPASGVFTMSDAPLTGDVISINYQFNLNPSSNSDTTDGYHASGVNSDPSVLAVTDVYGYVPNATYKNIIINGNAQVAQRPTASLSTTAAYGSVDRFIAQSTAAVTAGTITQATGLTNLGSTKTALRLSGVSSATNNQFFIFQRVEAAEARYLNNRPFSVSFIVNHNATAYVNAQVAIYTPTASDNYTSQTLAFTHPTTYAIVANTPSTVNFNNITGVDTSLGFALAIVLTPTTPPTTVNFDVSNVQLSKGTTASTFMFVPFREDLQSCQRYYEKGFSYANAPANNVDIVYHNGTSPAGLGGVYTDIGFKVTKRKTPSFTFYGVSNANWDLFDGAWQNATTTANNPTDTAFQPLLARTTGQTGYNDKFPYIIRGNWAADAEL